MHFLPENRMCAPPFVTKQRPPIWKILDPPLLMDEVYRAQKGNRSVAVPSPPPAAAGKCFLSSGTSARAAAAYHYYNLLRLTTISMGPRAFVYSQYLRKKNMLDSLDKISTFVCTTTDKYKCHRLLKAVFSRLPSNLRANLSRRHA